ncbi:MAG: transposase [Candidatus Pacebacteria bacterium]|nr:transposase [Candidatus Paceibacterota bacterium]
MRKQPIITGEYYHIYNRGVDKRDVFSDKMDIRRFVESINEFNQVDVIGSLINLRKSKNIQKGPKALSEEPLVVIMVYCLNPNHFHFVLKQLEDGGISKFMQKLQSGYTSYFNVKNSRSGSLFQGTFKAQHIGSENYFNKTLGYVNKNYQVHNIPEDKKELVFASDYEYENNNFKIVSKIEGNRILEIFGGVGGFKRHSDEIVEIIRKERGKTSLLEDEELPERA